MTTVLGARLMLRNHVLTYVNKLYLTSTQPCFTARENIQAHCTRTWILYGHRAVSRAAFDGRQHTLSFTSRAL
jgi:hypothetical protein